MNELMKNSLNICSFLVLYVVVSGKLLQTHNDNQFDAFWFRAAAFNKARMEKKYHSPLKYTYDTYLPALNRESKLHFFTFILYFS